MAGAHGDGFIVTNPLADVTPDFYASGHPTSAQFAFESMDQQPPSTISPLKCSPITLTRSFTVSD
jgi:hypothetical protein